MEKKAAIIKQVESGRSQADLGKEFEISKQTASDFMKNKSKILEGTKKSTGAKKKECESGCLPKAPRGAKYHVRKWNPGLGLHLEAKGRGFHASNERRGLAFLGEHLPL